MSATTTEQTHTPAPSATTAATALLVGFLLLMIGNGLQGSLLGIRAEAESFSTLWTGLIMTSYYGGFMLGTAMAARSLIAVGHVRVFAALASMASAATLIHAVAVLPPVWVGMRFLTGVCMAGLYVTTESWLNGVVTNETRGRMLAAYMIASGGGLGLGQLLLTTADPTTTTLFVISSVLVSISLVPIALSTAPGPAIEVPEPMNIRELIKVTPTGAVVVFLNGLTVGGLLGMGSVYASREGLDTNGIALFLGAAIVGSVAFQFPIGLLSDRLPRRAMILGLALSAAAVSLILQRTHPGSAISTGLMFVFGGVVFPLYSLGTAYANDWIPRNQLMGASASLVRINGLGALAGPVLISILFATVGDTWFFVGPAVTHIALAAFVIYRMLLKDALPMEKQRPWVPMASRGTYMISALTRPIRRR